MSPPMRCPDPKLRWKRILTFCTVGCKWGGFPAHPEEEAWGLLLEVSLLSSLSLFLPMWLSTSPYIPTPIFSFIFQGLDLLERAGTLREEAHRLEMEVQHLETGIGKDGSSGGRFRGRWFLWASERSNVTFLHILSLTPSQENLPHPIHHHLPSTPQESTGPDVSDPVDQAMKSASPAVPPASEKAIPTNRQPLHIHLGASNENTSARLRAARRVHQPHMPPFAHMYARCTWEWGWCVPPAANLFSTQTLSSTTRRAILISGVKVTRKLGGLWHS